MSTSRLITFLVKNVVDVTVDTIEMVSDYPVTLDLMQSAIETSAKCADFIVDNVTCLTPTFLMKTVEFCLWQKEKSINISTCNDTNNVTSTPSNANSTFNLTACLEDAGNSLYSNGASSDRDCWHNFTYLLFLALGLAKLTAGVVLGVKYGRQFCMWCKSRNNNEESGSLVSEQTDYDSKHSVSYGGS